MKNIEKKIDFIIYKTFKSNLFRETFHTDDFISMKVLNNIYISLAPMSKFRNNINSYLYE